MHSNVLLSHVAHVNESRHTQKRQVDLHPEYILNVPLKEFMNTHLEYAKRWGREKRGTCAVASVKRKLEGVRVCVCVCVAGGGLSVKGGYRW